MRCSRVRVPRIVLAGAAAALAALTALALPDRARATALQPADSAARAAGAGGATPVGSIVPSLPADTLETLAAEAMKAVVRLDVETDSGSRQGSGFIVAPDGQIFTNHHVVEGARTIEVKLASGDVYERVKLMAVDERRDLAVLEIPGFDLPTIPLGNSETVRIGTPVLAIGSPLGLENTVSTGIVSGRRSEPEGYHLLQITAPASQGSSGGPVVSRSGAAIGVAVSQMQNGQNLNFAVPINYARGLFEDLGSEPLAVLSPGTGGDGGSSSRMSSDPTRVNERLRFDLSGFHGFNLELAGEIGDDRLRRTRITYRRIDAVEGPPHIERYAESETTEQSGPFDTPRTVRRTRSRTIVAAGDLRPISVQGRTTWWDGERWHRSEYNLRFEGYHVTGTVTDSAGTVRELDRDLPPGILLRDVRHLAFATLAVDSLVGRSVEFVTFDASRAETTSDRYDVRDSTTVVVDGRERRALRVNLASGLSNATAYFGGSVPRVLLRRETGAGDAEEASNLRHFDRGTVAAEPDGGGGDGSGEPD